MELLVFLYMGGALEDVHMRSAKSFDMSPAVLDATGHGHSERIISDSQICSFSSKRTRCSNDSDRQMLLAVVEVGFGGHSKFDEVVKDMMLRLIGRPSAHGL